MKHLSSYGTTCWFCGHPASRGLTFGKTTYKACDRCRKAPLLAESAAELRLKVWTALDADLDAIAERREHRPLYFVPAEFSELRVHYEGVGPRYLVERKPKEWADDFAQGAKDRETEQRREYNRRVREHKRSGN